MSIDTHIDALRAYCDSLQQSLFSVRADESRNHGHLTESINIVTQICENLDERLKAIEQRLDAQDEYNREQNER